MCPSRADEATHSLWTGCSLPLCKLAGAALGPRRLGGSDWALVPDSDLTLFLQISGVPLSQVWQTAAYILGTFSPLPPGHKATTQLEMLSPDSPCSHGDQVKSSHL